MSDLKGKVEVEFYCTLSDDDHAADQEFDAICDEIDRILNRATIERVFSQSFSIVDGDTRVAD